jgi:LacI family transcriptional regulator
VLLALDFYSHAVHRGVVGYARRAGWLIDARCHHLNLGTLPEGWSADGILSFFGPGDIFGPALRSAGLPLVNTSPYLAELGLPTVRADDRASGTVAAEHLLDRGLQHLAMVQFAPLSPTSAARRAGFDASIAAAGRHVHDAECPGPARAAGRQAQLKWLKQLLVELPHPLGVFAESDLWAVEVIHQSQAAGLSVPDDVAVVGVDNDGLIVDVAQVTVTSVDNDLEGVGFRAAELLGRLLSGEAPPTAPVLVPPVGIVQRQSTDVFAVTDRDLAAALRFIHAHFSEPIQVDDVVDQTSTSRRRLQDLFRDHLGRPIAEEVRRCRLDLAKRLLRETGLKVAAVAERAGLGSGMQLHKLLTQEVGVGPAKYRQSHASR